MRLLSYLGVVAATGWAAMAQAQAMPECATGCLAEFLPDSACEATDAECICADEALMTGVEACTMGSCTVIEGLVAANATATMCGDTPRDRSLVAPIATAISGTLALIFVLIRVYICWSNQEWAWTDACAFVAMASSIPMDVGEFFMMHYGMGRDIWTLTPENITQVVKWTWVTQVSYIPAIILTKMSIVGIFLRVFPDETFRKFCFGTLVHCALFMVSTFIAAILACVPVEHAWSVWSGVGSGVCFDNNAFWWAHSAINISTDLWVLGMPITQLWRLNLNFKKKLYLVLMFSVGIVITVISIVRFSGLLQYSFSTNPTYNNVMVATYSVIECNVSIMCCCMPAILALLRRNFPHLFGTSGGSYERSVDPNKPRSLVTFGGSGASSKPKSGIQKSVTNTVSYEPRPDDGSDQLELMDVEGNRLDRKWHE